MKVAFIGLGIMGSRMAANLLKSGVDLVVYNRSKNKAQDLLAGGATWAETPAAAAKQANIIITMLGSPEVVRELALGAEGLLQSPKTGSLWIDSSTVNPSFSFEMAQVSKARDVRFLDAPVAGTKGPAEQGQLLFLIGGEQADVEYAQPLFDAMGRKTLHLGGHGKGASMKMLINLLLGQSMLAFSEAVVLGKGMGLDRQKVLDVLLGAPITVPFLEAVRPKLENSNYEPNFPLKWMHKDLQLATQTAYEHDIAMPSLNTAKEVYALAKQGGFADQDFSGIFAFLDAVKDG